jgi:hypothetical protein
MTTTTEKAEAIEVPAEFKSDLDRDEAVQAALAHLTTRSENWNVHPTLLDARRLAWRVWREGGGVSLARARLAEIEAAADERRRLRAEMERQGRQGVAATLAKQIERDEREAAELEILIGAAGAVRDPADLARAADEAEQLAQEAGAVLARYGAGIPVPPEVTERFTRAIETATRARKAHRHAVEGLTKTRGELRAAESAVRSALASPLIAELVQSSKSIAALVRDGGAALAAFPTLHTPATGEIDQRARAALVLGELVERLGFDGAMPFERALGAAARDVLRARGHRLRVIFEEEPLSEAS